MGDFLPGSWKKCVGMNRNGKCVAPLGTHLRHRKSFGTWYGQVADRKAIEVSKPSKSKRPIKPGWFR
jgi:hypothetical protein